MSEQVAPRNCGASHDPVVLATLAIQFLQPRLAKIQNPNSPVIPVLYDRLYADALEQAGRLLEMAALRDDPDVHAYQIFKPNEEAQSFGVIEKRLKTVGWKGPCAENTLKGYGFEIVEAAQKEVQKRMGEIDTVIGHHLGTDAELTATTDRIRKFLSKLIKYTRLIRQLSNPENVIESCVHCLIQEVQNRVNCGGASNIEFAHDFSAYGSFIKYVCDGLSFNQFMASETRTARRVRPYELFLFAHQKGIRPKDLTVKRSDLNADWLPEPAWPYSCSILSGHGGVPGNQTE